MVLAAGATNAVASASGSHSSECQRPPIITGMLCTWGSQPGGARRTRLNACLTGPQPLSNLPCRVERGSTAAMKRRQPERGRPWHDGVRSKPDHGSLTNPCARTWWITISAG